MAVATWRILAFGTLLGAVTLPASAQVVIGGSGRPSVEVNWAVLDSLGRQPTLADMLKGEEPPVPQVAPAQGKARSAAPQGVQFKPYVPPKVAKAKAKVSAPKKAVATPAVAKAEPDVASSPMATLVQATQKEVPAAAPTRPHVAEAVEVPAAKAVAATAPAGPQVSLPEVPKSVAAPAQEAEVVSVPKAEVVSAPKAEAVPTPAQTAEAVSAAAAPATVVPAVTAKADPVPAPVPAAAPSAAIPSAAIPSAAIPSAAPAPVAAPTALTPPPLPVPDSQVTALPPVPAQVPVSVVSSKGDTLSVVFGGDSANLPGAAQPELDKLVKRLRKDDGLGLQLLAFAEGDDANASKARRLSLSRALEVRKYLMDQGVRSTRIEVRALGNKLEGAGPADRVDAVVVSR